MKYTFQCPACSKALEVDAVDEEDAVNKLMEAGKEHGGEVHKDMNTPPEEMLNLVKTNMKQSSE